MNTKDRSTDLAAAKRTIDLLQEIVWSIQSRSGSDLQSGIDYLQSSVSSASANKVSKKSKERQHLLSLVGSMPLILADVELFPSNEHIAKFALEALGIPIARWEKRSRYEMIGMLVMLTINLSEDQLKGLSTFLGGMTTGGNKLARIKKQVNEVGFSWNEAIRSLTSKED